MSRVALVEDHDRLAGLVRKALSNSGIEADVFSAMESAWHGIQANTYAVLIVDRGLPDGDGLALVRRLRAVGNGTPCLMLTAQDAVHDRVEGLESGADDYLAKPFPMEELVARVRALSRRTPTLRSLTPTFMDLTVLPNDGCMLCGKNSVTLAPSEVQIMLLLVNALGRTVRRTALEAAAWGLSEAVTPNALDVALHRLRKKLLTIGSVIQISNIRGHGYALQETTVVR